jgi:hypothetical protein
MVANATAVRSISGAFKRSAGGARTRVMGKYYFIDETQYVDTNFSDFSWSSTPHSTGSFVTTEDAVSYDLYDFDTGSLIGEITDTRIVTPKVGINYFINQPAYSESVHLAFMRTNISTAPPDVFTGVGLFNIPNPTSGFAPSSYGLAAAIGTTFFVGPGSTGTLIKDGKYFYPVVFRIPIDGDFDVDAWFNGKYTDVFDGAFTTYHLTLKNFKQSSYTSFGNTFQYYDSYTQNTFIFVRG